MCSISDGDCINSVQLLIKDYNALNVDIIYLKYNLYILWHNKCYNAFITIKKKIKTKYVMKAQALNQPLKRLLIAVFILSGILGVKAQSASTLYLTGTKDTNAKIFQADLKTGNSNLTDRYCHFLIKLTKLYL